ncbi:MAG: hypothetical protein HQ538_00995 [Parcubacteria group bacterium]|nr:hypothetical protein [Parcubacteria group bacterium]
MPKVIYLDVDEEITSVIDKIKKVEDKQDVALFFPKRASLTKSIVNLKLLKRQIDLLGRNIFVVTSDETGFNLAERSGFKVKKTLEQNDENVEKVNFEEKDEKGKINIENFLKDDKELEREKRNQSLPSENNKTVKDNLPKKKDKPFLNFLNNKKDTKKKRSSKKIEKGKVVLLPSFGFKSLLFFFLISFILISIIFFVVLPKAIITITPKLEPFSSDFEISVSGNVDSLDQENKIIPGATEEVEIKSNTKKFDSTGEKDVGIKAGGTVVLYNNYSSSPQVLVASTRLQSQGKTYLLLSETTIPGAQIEGGKQVPGVKEVVIEAEASGEDYNIGPSNFIIPGLALTKQKNIYGKSESSVTGGSTEKMKIITEEDLNKAKDSLLEEISQEGIENIENKISGGDMIARSTVQNEIIELKTNGENEKEADNFEMELRAKIIAMSFSKDEVEELIFTSLNNELSQEKFFINDNIEKGVDFEGIDFNVEHKQLNLRLHINKEVGWRIDETMVKKAIKGKTSEETTKYLLENSIGEDAKVEFWPFWIKKVPQIEKKIKIILDTSQNIDKMGK